MTGGVYQRNYETRYDDYYCRGLFRNILLTLVTLSFTTLLCQAKNENTLISRNKRFCDACGCCSNQAPFVPIQRQENPCANGQALLGANNMPIYCNWQMKDSCPSSHFCHVGMSMMTTTCCPHPSGRTPCELPVMEGEGNYVLPRWYYNAQNKICTSFSYRGLKGNPNSFLTKQLCDEACPTKLFSSPCLNGNPAKDSNGNVLFCKENINSCPEGFHCHLGGASDDILCCPIGGTRLCDFSMAKGEGVMQLKRWYYDSSSNLCREFVYFGSKGNANNFADRQTCEATCQVFRDENPCPWGEPLLKELKVENCSSRIPCPETHWCHLGSNGENSCCPIIGKLCELPLAVGEGDSNIKRWYYNSGARDCFPFVYKGTKGNANNFVSDADCRVSCPVWQNPCPVGEPAVLPDGSPQLCSGSFKDCPATYWCHIGSDARNSVCCPKAQNPCTQLLSPGVGMSFLQRWYYNGQVNMCQQFIYSGIKGNQNNFESETQCSSTCLASVNPCADMDAENPKNQKQTKCSHDLKCKSGYYCHFGASAETTLCCPQTGNPCDLPVRTGQGEASLTRWFFDSSAKRCAPFSYKGLKGNPNNFRSAEECRMVCPEINVCGDDSKPYTVDGQPFKCAQQSCPENYFCHYGINNATTVCCPKKGRQGDNCRLPSNSGVGGNNLVRWYYSADSHVCNQFFYKGIGGNENNYLSREDCENECLKDVCPHGAPLMNGSSMVTCKEQLLTCPDKYLCHVNAVAGVAVCCSEPESFCYLPRDPGNCGNYTKRFGYDPILNNCEEFAYGGCGGNLNNFPSVERCTEICCNEFVAIKKSKL